MCRKQERLEFLYDSGLAVGKVSTDEYLLGKPVEPEKTQTEVEKVKSHSGVISAFIFHESVFFLISCCCRAYFFLHMFLSSFILHHRL